MKNYVYAHTETKEKDNTKTKKITSKHWQVYYYLLSISYYDSVNREDHRFVYKDKFNINAAAKFLGISRATVYNALDALNKAGLVTTNGESYLIYAKTWVKVELDTLKILLSCSKTTSKNIDLLRTYLILKKMTEFANSKEDMKFTKYDLIKILGHSTVTPKEYDAIRDYLALLSYFNLIEIKSYTDYREGLGKCTIYYLQKVYEKSDKQDEFISTTRDMSESVLPDYLRDKVEEF